MEQLFAQVLVLCARVGMGQLGVVALDSVKIAANADSHDGPERGRRVMVVVVDVLRVAVP